MTRIEAIDLLNEYIESESLRKHCLCVGASMRYYAKKYGEDADAWEIAGILHDLDWEKHPDVHPDKCIELLRSLKESEEMIHAISAHKYTEQIESLMDRALFACDELSGFIYACILVRPTKTMEGLEVKSIKKKMKDKAFARAVPREDMEKGAELLGIPLDDHIQNIINAFSSMHEELGI